MGFIRKYFIYLGKFDRILFGSVFLLLCFSLSALYSIAVSSEQSNWSNFNRQIFFIVVGLTVLFGAALVDYRVWVNYSPIFFGLVGLLLLAVIFFGKTISGTTGWFSLFGVNLQPVEIAKVTLIIILAWFLGKPKDRIRELKYFAGSLGITLAYMLLVFLQPDFGSAAVLLVIWLVMIFFAGAPKKYLMMMGAAGLVVFFLLWTFYFAEYQRDRIKTFINPQSDPLVSGWHVKQSTIAIGAGGLLGRGLGFGSQSQLKFIPASHTDFIFAVIAEELGFLGVILILFFLGLIFYRLFRAILSSKDSFSQIFIIGVSGLFLFQIFVNIGMNIGLVPVTGISLPFLSYGGSFLVSCLALIGITQSMIIRSRL